MAAAAVSGALKVLGVLNGVLGFIPFATQNFGGTDSASSVIKVTVGLDVPGGLQNAGGDLPDVRLFNEAGQFIGSKTNPGTVRDGSTAEIKVAHKDKNGQQASYALFSANDNAICVASVSITWPNGDQYGWVGDWGQACGGSWYFSNVFIEGSSYKPNCLWIDANGDQPQTGFQIHFPEFVSKDDNNPAPISQSVDYYCNSGPPFKLYYNQNPRSIVYWILQNGKRALMGRAEAPPARHQARRTRIHQRRQPQTRRQSRNQTQPRAPSGTNRTIATAEPTSAHFDQYLVTSQAAQHSAAVLCGSKSSVGPDFANPAERLFCRMADKTLWPFCDGFVVTDDCFDARLQQLVVGGKVARDKRYVKVVSWGEGEDDAEGLDEGGGQ